MKKLYFYLVLVSLFVIQAEVQSANRLAGNLQSKEAEKYFYAQQYDKAAPLFAQLISTDPQNFRYNYFYGICLLVISENKASSIPYLEKALQSENSPEDVYYYLGRSYHYAYRFEDAQKMYKDYLSYIGVKEGSKLLIPDLIIMCDNAKELLDTSKFSGIVGKWTATPNDFFETYRFPDHNGKLLRMPDALSERSENQPGEKPMVFLSANGRVMYFSRKSEVSNSFDIFRCEKNSTGQWDRPFRIDATVNSGKDELYPTCNEDGRILYFSSKGHNSTGGFDIFKTYYNPVTRIWCKPENAGSPFNSPDDDYCLVASREKNEACFVSQRETAPGTFTVYRVGYASSDDLPHIINGKFKCMGKTITPPSCRVFVKKENQNGFELVSSAEVATEDYAVEIPEPGTYQISAIAEGYEANSQIVTIDENTELTTTLDIRFETPLSGMKTSRKNKRRGSNRENVQTERMAQQTTGVGSDDYKVKNNEKLNPRRVKRNEKNTASAESKSASAKATEEIIYKVQIGAFRNTPEHIVEKELENRTDRTMLSSYGDNDWKRYFMGAETSLESARNLSEILIEIGFKDAFIVGFKDGVPHQLSELQVLPDNVASGDGE